MKIDKPITSMARLRKEKRKLEQRIEMEKQDLYMSAEAYKNSLWPFRLLNKFRKTVDAVSDNKLLVLGAQIAYAVLEAVKHKSNAGEGSKKNEDGKQDSEHEETSKGGKVVNFLKDMAKSFIDLQKSKDDGGKKKD